MSVSRPGRRRQGGFTLLEVMVVNMLMGLLMVLVAGAWRAFGPLCVEVIARSRIAGEANVAAVSLDKDIHNPRRSFATSNPLVADGTMLTITYEQAGQPWPVIYTFVPSLDPVNKPEDGKLTRWDGNGSITIARHVEAMNATQLTGTSAELKLSFFYRNSRSQYTFELVP